MGRSIDSNRMFGSPAPYFFGCVRFGSPRALPLGDPVVANSGDIGGERSWQGPLQDPEVLKVGAPLFLGPYI